MKSIEQIRQDRREKEKKLHEQLEALDNAIRALQKWTHAPQPQPQQNVQGDINTSPQHDIPNSQ